ncbi:preprotein translocase subunit YajC [Micrococcales bacterium 31B]|nr:preprotein translocase subunit YajC [Micrococcales bacterium 31B]
MDSTIMFILIAVLLVFMIFTTRNNKKRMAAAEAQRNALAEGTRVYTHSGFVGTIVEKNGEEVVLETDSGAQSTWMFKAIAGERPAADAHAGDVADEASDDDAVHNTATTVQTAQPVQPESPINLGKQADAQPGPITRPGE